MKKILALTALVIASSLPSVADTLATWTFESTGLGTYSPGAGVVTTNFYAEGGLQAGTAAASGFHSGTSVYSSPVGNGSSKSLSSAGWAIGDYWQFQLSTVGYNGLSLSFDQTGSGTGPRDFTLSYSLDGSSFTPIGNTYSILANASPNPLWNGTTSSSVYTSNINLGSLVDDLPTVYLRLTDVSTVSASGGTVGSGGTDRVDNFSVFTTPVPEPSTVAFGILGGLAGLFVWKRRK